ncbi:MAG: hypothetical protein AAF215_15805 [Cyanobacteria bacterium P01_A01_bin.123]
MSQKIAIAVIHGIGQAQPDFADPQDRKFLSGIASRLQKAFSNELKDQMSDAGSELVFEPIYWAEVVQKRQEKLYRNLGVSKLSRFFGARDFIFHSLADSIAYQPTSSASDSDVHIYEDVHRVFGETLSELANKAGENAPLCIIGHSMGAAIASNYIWDMQHNKFPANSNNNPLEQGKTLSALYTFGSQIPFWAMRFEGFGVPIQIPSPELTTHHPNAQGEWINFYDRDDLLGYPIQSINQAYKAAVTHEYEVKVGNLLTGWNTFSHNGYWTSKNVTRPIASSLARLWQQVNSQ